MKGILLVLVLFSIFSACNNGKNPKLFDIPESSEILFVSNRDTGTDQHEIYAVDADGENLTRITKNKYHHFLIHISPDKRYIVASRALMNPETGKPETKMSLWLLDLETKKEKQLTDSSWHAEGRTFSPDSKWVAFCMNKTPDFNGTSTQVYKMKIDGTGLTQLTDIGNGTESNIFANCDPSWSNDGSLIAFTSLSSDTGRYGPRGRALIRVMDANDGGNKIIIYNDVFGNGTGNESIGVPGVFPPGSYDAFWSPNDEYLVFETTAECTENNITGYGCTENFGSGNWHILKVEIDGNQTWDLSIGGNHTNVAEYLPSFSPDGSSVVLGAIFHDTVTPENSFNEIFLIDSVTGGIIRRVTFSPPNTSAMYPQWIR